MSRTYSAIRNNHHKRSKVYYQAYFYNPNESLDDTYSDTLEPMGRQRY